MCALFGLVDYGNKFSARQRNKIISVLSEECEVRGTMLRELRTIQTENYAFSNVLFPHIKCGSDCPKTPT